MSGPERSHRRWIRPIHLIILTALVLPPGYAIVRLWGVGILGGVAVWTFVVGVITYSMYAGDKKRAENHEWRRSEATLHLLELAGGWPSAFLAQRSLRHKSSKLSYQAIFWLIVGLYEFASIDALLNWPVARSAIVLVR